MSYSPLGGAAESMASSGGAAPVISSEAADTASIRNEATPRTLESPPALAPENVDAAFASDAQGWRFEPALLWSELDRLDGQMESAIGSRSKAVLLGASLSLATAVGFVVWKLCTDYLLASAAAGTPLWKQTAREFDPLVVLENWEIEYRLGRDKESLQSLLA